MIQMSKYHKLMKNQMKVGIGSMVGMSAVGTIGGLTGQSGTANLVNTGIGLANIGQFAHTATKILPSSGKRKSKDCSVVKNFLR
jgi:hypothetical protein